MVGVIKDHFTGKLDLGKHWILTLGKGSMPLSEADPPMLRRGCLPCATVLIKRERSSMSSVRGKGEVFNY